jgi:hypothetical protein
VVIIGVVLVINAVVFVVEETVVVVDVDVNSSFKLNQLLYNLFRKKK